MRRRSAWACLLAALVSLSPLSCFRNSSHNNSIKRNPTTDPLLRGFEFRSTGPTTMMGRVDDIAGAEKDPMIVYIGAADGGMRRVAGEPSARPGAPTRSASRALGQRPRSARRPGAPGPASSRRLPRRRRSAPRAARRR